MGFADLAEQTRDVLTVKRVFGDAYEKDGITLIPAASIRGGVGGGEGESPGGEGKGSGGGYGVIAHPTGAYVIADGRVTWQPAIDRTRVLLALISATIVALLTLRSIARARTRALTKVIGRRSA